MKLTSAQVENTMTQIAERAIPEDHPVVPQLKGLFGEHTFFLGNDGLKIVEPTGAEDAGSQTACVVRVASWADPERTTLAPHEPQPTEVLVDIDAET
jgi:hypothetical protein